MYNVTNPTITQSTSIKQNYWSVKWINLLQAPELQDWSYVINSENYFHLASWKLESRQWTVEFFSNTVWKAVRMLEKFSDNIFVFSAGNTVYYYTVSTDTITTVWSYWEETDDDFVWVKYWDYLYFTNWSWKIQYLTFDYNLVNDDTNNILVPKWGNYVEDASPSENFTVDNNVWWDRWHCSNFNWLSDRYYEWAFAILSWADRTDPNTPVWRVCCWRDESWNDDDPSLILTLQRWNSADLTGQTIEIYDVLFKSSNNREAYISYSKNANLNSSYWWKFKTPLNLWNDNFKIDVYLRSQWESSTNDADAYLYWFWDSYLRYDDFWWTSIQRIDYKSWSNQEPYFSFSTWSADYSAQMEIQRFDIYKRDDNTITSWQLNSSPVWAKRLLVFADTDWARLYTWNTKTDNTEIKYSALDQVKNLWEVAFETWTSSNTPLLRTDAWGFTNSNLWELKDFWILNNEIVAFFENWKKAFHIEIDTVEESWIAIQVQKIVSRERQDFWWERNPLLTQEWLFYTNESWVWRMLAMWSDIAWTLQEENITEILWVDFVQSIDFTNSDMVYDNVRWNIIITCWYKTSWVNDLILVYNVSNKSWSKITWINTERLTKDSTTIYWSCSESTKVYKLFEWNNDCWNAINTTFEFEVPLDLNTLYKLEEMVIKWDFVWDEFGISLDIYDHRWEIFSGYKIIETALQSLTKLNTIIKRLSRIVIKITCKTTQPHTINYILAWIKKLQDNKFRKTYSILKPLRNEDWNILTTENWTKIII